MLRGNDTLHNPSLLDLLYSVIEIGNRDTINFPLFHIDILFISIIVYPPTVVYFTSRFLSLSLSSCVQRCAFLIAPVYILSQYTYLYINCYVIIYLVPTVIFNCYRSQYTSPALLCHH